ncbi:hypothetical protein I5Q34_02010 [Streptomyces sp. AV19]|uniref:hypothetical protein n=1 Tax=Streptomyces sp. AV19 TaxID=2793068 RepID=UPI0018FE47F0|nr:hypothetical protein [Streptomyces sp. AV19]MBH1933076.1 hypothetical protein [Streptomyces sp. AV19]MDG4531788.1 hypothetical protein [Streptomyces sp. AV19]
MNHETPLSPRPLHHLSDVRHRVMTSRQLREHGVPASEVSGRCRPGGPWQQILPGVHLLHRGPATSEERLHAALMYTRARAHGIPAQAPRSAEAPYGEAMITGLAALALHRFTSAPPLLRLEHIDVLVPHTRRLRATGFVRPVRAHSVPRPRLLTGIPVAPVPRAVADAVAQLTDPDRVRRLLTEAVRGGHCEPARLLRELTRARLLDRAPVAAVMDALLAEGRAAAEDRLYAMVSEAALPSPLWNVELLLPGGPSLGAVDAYWPDHGVVVEIDTRTRSRRDNILRDEVTRKHEHLEQLGLAVVAVTPKQLRESPEQLADTVRATLVASAERAPGAYVVVVPR